MTASGSTHLLGWRELAWAALAVVCAAGTYYACQTPEPASTAIELASAVCDAGPSELDRLIERHVAPGLEVEISGRDAQTFTHRELLAALRGARGRRGRSCSVELHDWRTESGGDGATWLEATLEWSDSQPSDLHARGRRVRALFRQSSSASDVVQRLERVSVGPPLRAEPEARP